MDSAKKGFFRKKITMRWYWTLLTLLALAVLAMGVSVIIQQGSFVSTAKNFLRQPVLLLLNTLPCAVLLSVLYALIGNAFYAGAVNTVFFALMSLINLIKIEGRNDPFVPGDITCIREAMQATGEYQLNLHPELIIATVILAAVLVLLGIKIKSARPKALWRCVLSAAAAGVMVLCVFTLYSNTELYATCIANSGTYVNQYNIPSVFDGLGFNYCFLRNVTMYNIEKPAGYSQKEAEQWASQKTEQSATQRLTPNVIFVQCEAFSDLFDDAVFGYTPEDNPLYWYHQLQADAHSVSGHIVVSDYGAGTANTEFDILTGMPTTMIGARASALRSFHKNTSSLARVFAADGYSTYFMHPGDRWFYNRESAYSFLGITDQTYKDSFTSEDIKGNMVSDEAFKNKLLADIDTHASPLFAFTVSIQNHQAYPYGKYNFTVEKAPLNKTVSAETEETISVYAEGIRDSSAMVYSLAQALNESDTPTVLVFWGDHLPAMGSNFSVYQELGLDVGNDTDGASTVNTHKTPFLIWANDAYCEQADYDAGIESLSLGDDPLISDFYLGSLVYELLDMDGCDAYFDFLTQARRSLPVIYPPYCRTADGAYTDTPDEAQLAIVDKLRKWEYYRLTDEVVE